jgi:hypothetical protein
VRSEGTLTVTSDSINFWSQRMRSVWPGVMEAKGWLLYLTLTSGYEIGVALAARNS